MEPWSRLETRFDALEPLEARNGALEVLEARNGALSILEARYDALEFLEARNGALEAREARNGALEASGRPLEGSNGGPEGPENYHLGGERGREATCTEWAETQGIQSHTPQDGPGMPKTP